MSSVEPLDRSHGGLDVQGLHVLPVLLQQRDEEVHGEMDVLDELLLRHPDIADRHGQAEDLLHLELDGGLQVGYLSLQVVAVGHQGGELASLAVTNIRKVWMLLIIILTLFSPGPSSLGICLIRVSEARKASY